MTLLAWLFCRRSILRTVQDRECPDRTKQAMACLWSHVDRGILDAQIAHAMELANAAAEESERKGWRK